MLEALLFIVVGMYIGWNVPMPVVAKDFQTKVINYFKGSQQTK
jgi:hypothetical protein